MELSPTRGSADVPRRRFLTGAAAGLLLGAVGGCASTERPANFGARRSLAKPGPMLPPVPAVWVTSRGREGDPDEISVLWSFVINGDPPQIGVAAGTEHIVGDLIAGEAVTEVNRAEIDVEDWRVEFFDPSAGQAAAALALIGAGLGATLPIGRFGGGRNETPKTPE